MMSEEYRERIAAVQHEIWSHWMRYLFSVCPPDSFGNGIIPAEKAQRWQRQMNTDYANLTDKERESDRDQADKVLAERDAEIAALRQQVAELQATEKKLCAEIHAADIRGVLDWTS